MMFRDRKQAAGLLVPELQKIPYKNPLVLAIPRGGLPLGDVIARSLRAPLSVLIAKKIAHPSNPEYAVGAATRDDFLVDDRYGISDEYLSTELARVREQIIARMAAYGVSGEENYSGKDIILVDDGIATGRTVKAGIQLLKKHHPNSITVAVPLATGDAAREISVLCDHWVCLNEISGDFPGVGAFYETFGQVSDEEAVEILRSYH